MHGYMGMVVYRNLSGSTEENDENTLSKLHRDSLSQVKVFRRNLSKFVVIKFWIGIFARRTFLLFRFCSLHVKMQGAHIHIFLFTDCKNNRLQKKLMMHNVNA